MKIAVLSKNLKLIETSQESVAIDHLIISILRLKKIIRMKKRKKWIMTINML